METGEPLGRAEFWQRLAGFSFGMWALAIPIGVAMVRGGVDDVLRAHREQVVAFNNYVLTMERRVTLIEERQARVLSTIVEHERRMEELRPQNGGARR